MTTHGELTAKDIPNGTAGRTGPQAAHDRAGVQTASPGNGGTLVELHTRSRCLLSQSGGKWTVRQKDRAKILFEKYSKLCEAYGLVCRLRSIFRDKMLLREEAWTKLHEWYAKVAACTIR